MSVLIIATPLFDDDMTVKAYKLCDHNPEIALDVKGDFREKNQTYYLPGLDLIQETGLAPFSGDLPLFVEASRFHLLTCMASNKKLPPERLILIVSENEEADGKLLIGLEGLREKGYSLAVGGWPSDGADSPLFGYADHIILDYQAKQFDRQYREAKTKLRGKQVIVTGLPDMESYGTFSGSRNTLFGGSFFNNPVTGGSSEISPLKVNALQLMRQINDEDFDLSTIAKTIERDPSLSISLLRFINSAAVGLRQKVDSINSAVAILGQKEIRRWATIAISISLSQDRPSEITKLSLVRAKFAENLAPLFELGIFMNSLFMTGLFSLLDLILKKPMDEAVSEIAVDNLVREALVDRSGTLFKVLDFIYAYERADWNKVSIIMIQGSIDGERVGHAFIDALVWYNQLLESIDEIAEDGAL
ncbi:MAG: HDOD domain-containing protein [Clostridiales bacterium]|nr:HDOD domain-containing protein [Clostridiales bacterium]